jgi:hypothetical protein
MDRDFPPCLLEYNETGRHRKIKLIEGNAKCGHLKKLTCKGTLRQAQNPKPPPLTHCIRVYNILIHTEKMRGGRELNQREGERGNISQSWVDNTNMTDYISSL